MDQVHVIRHKVLVEKKPIRRVAREMGISRNTVVRYLEISEPQRVETRPRARPVYSAVVTRLHALLEEAPQWTTPKQRLTATRLHAMLREEGFDVGVTLVKATVAEWKRTRREVFVPLVYPPGDLAEVDFFEVTVEVASKREKAWMFVLRLMFSGRDFAWLYARQDQASFLDGHVRAFAHLGAVPRRIAYDNLKAAVLRPLVGSERELSPRFAALASHYLFEPCFCRPRTGHDKGGVESRGKSIRWQHLVPIPSGDNMHMIRTDLLARLDAQAHQECDDEGRSIHARFESERTHMFVPPTAAFRARITRPVQVSRRSLVMLEGAVYSVPSTWADLSIVAHVGADDVEFVGPQLECVVRARRSNGEKNIDYRDYLAELAKKPQALRQVAAELIRDLGAPFDRAWRSLVDLHGPKPAARIFAKLLGFIEERGIEAVALVIERALAHGEPLLQAFSPPTSSASIAQEKLPLSLRTIEVTSASAADFDELLKGGAQ